MSVTNTTFRPRSFGPTTATAQRLITGVHTFLYRLSGGVIGGRLVGCPVLLLTTAGRKSGKARTIPILYLADRGRFVLVASNGGTAKHPLWYLNLLANPQAQVQVGGQKLSVTAEVANAEERKRLWPLVTAMYASYTDYQKRTPREIPLVILHPADRS